MRGPPTNSAAPTLAWREHETMRVAHHEFPPRTAGSWLAILLAFWLPGLAVSIQAAQAVDAPLEFTNAAEEERYRGLLEELRCLVCQNQTLADSSADLAQDLRNEVHARVRAGQPDREIIDFMVQRYGDFVLYRPPVKTSTWLLWAGPFLLLALGGIIVLRRARAASAAEIAPLDAGEQLKLRKLLPGSNGGERA